MNGTTWSSTVTLTPTAADTAWEAAGVADLNRDGRVDILFRNYSTGANLLWVTSGGDAYMAGARLPAAPLADRLRNELAVATAVDGGDAVLPDLDAAVAAGRADLIVVDHLPAGAR